jgi:hypothetical protein
MDKGFVYIARLIDYGGNFLGNFHKIGKSVQYKVRETQLNSTHLPVDIIFIRVFETENQSMLEQILHTCFEDYRIQKQYTDRRNITTEWFDVDDADVLNNRIDKVIKYIPNTSEVNIISKISSDSGTTTNEKEELVSTLRRVKSKLIFKLNGEDVSAETSRETYLYALTKIAENVGWEKLDLDEDSITKNVDDFREKYLKSFTERSYREIGDYKVWVNLSNMEIKRILNRHIMRNNIPNMEISIQTIS